MVEGRTIAVAGAKGGVGKTTTCLNLGAEFAAAGYGTVVVELDLGMANVLDFLDLDLDPDREATFHEVLAGEATVDEAVREALHGLEVLPSGTSLDGYAETDLDRLPGLTSALRQAYDIVLFDTPAGVSEETVEPIRLADEMVLVSTPRVSSVRNADNTLELAERMDVETRGLVVTKSGTGASPGAKTIADFLDLELLGHVPEEESIPYSQDRGVPVVANAPESDAARAYREIARELAPGEFIFPPSADVDERDPALEGRLARPTTGPDFRTPGRGRPDRSSRAAESPSETVPTAETDTDETGPSNPGPPPEEAPMDGPSESGLGSDVSPDGGSNSASATSGDGEPGDESTPSLRRRVLSYLTG
jgi:septum site-determining protein MinD